MDPCSTPEDREAAEEAPRTLEPPTDLVTSEVTYHSFRASWFPPDIAAEKYRITYVMTAGGPTMETFVDGETVVLENLTPLTEYQVNVYAMVGEDSSEPLVGTETTLPVPGPADLVVFDEKVTSMKVRWTQAQGATGYMILYRALNATDDQLQREVRVGPVDNVELMDLTPNTAYEIQLFALHGETTSLPLEGTGVTHAWCKTTAKADIVLLLDGSWSVGKINFKTIQAFIARIVSVFDIGPDRMQIGLVQYSRDPKTEWHLNSHPTKASLLDAVANLPYKGGSTMTGMALNYTLHNNFHPNVGLREDARKIGVLITDGKSQDDTVAISQNLRDSGIELYAIGVRNADEHELRSIATDPDGIHVYIVHDFEFLLDTVDDLTENLCNSIRGPDAKCNTTAKADIMLLVDGSSSIGQINFKTIRRFITRMVSVFDIGPDRVQIGLAQYSRDPRTEWHLNSHPTKSSLMYAVANLPYMRGNTMTGLALNYILQNNFRPNVGLRDDAWKIGVLITDGKSQDDTVVSSQNLRDSGIELYAIGVKNADENELRSIASDPDEIHMYNVNDFQFLLDIVDDLSDNLCNSVKGPDAKCKTTAKADIVLLVDGSWSIGRINFKTIRNFIARMVSVFDIGPDRVQIGLAQYSGDPKTEWHLNSHQTTVSLLDAVANLPYKGGNTMTGMALNYILQNNFHPNVGMREDARKIAVLITDGKSEDEIVVNSQNLRDSGIELYAIGVNDADENELRSIASDPDENHMYNVNKFPLLLDIVDNLTDNLCNSVKAPAPGQERTLI